MSYTAALAGPSLAPLLVMLGGSKPLISPALSTVNVPPGWMSALGAVVDDPTTFWMPFEGVLLTATVVGVALLVVAVLALALLAVVDVDAPATADVDVVVSPVSL